MRAFPVAEKLCSERIVLRVLCSIETSGYRPSASISGIKMHESQKRQVSRARLQVYGPERPSAVLDDNDRQFNKFLNSESTNSLWSSMR
jgi:hypothetical protein